MFFGRYSELENLLSFYNNDNFKTAVIYGRCGIGKTSLLRKFCEDKNHVFFSAYATTGKQENETLARLLGIKSKLSDGIEAKEGLSVILQEINDRAEVSKTPLLFVIDNYPHFVRANSDFDKILNDFIKESRNIKLVLIGDSYLSMGKIFFDKKTLWKNIDLCFELKAFGYYETLEYLHDINDGLLKSQLYGITGGIPLHLSKVKVDLETSIEEIFIKNSEESMLPERSMLMELRELSYYNHILSTLAKGLNRVNQISQSVDKPKDVVVPYMNTLMSIGVVTKENPVTERTNRKKTRYSIINSFDVFWYRFFAPYYEYFCQKDLSKIMEISVNPGFSRFMETVFVSMCKEYLIRQSAKGKYEFSIDEIGNWWLNDDEKQTTNGFDLVAVGEAKGEESIIFGRCYYTEEPIGIATLKELIDLTKQVKGKKNVYYLVFSKTGFHENTTTVAATIKNIILVSLEDIVNG